MDKLASEILAEVQRKPGEKFYPEDLLHLQSHFDVEMQMLWLLEQGYVGGGVLPPSVPGISDTSKIAYIIYYD